MLAQPFLDHGILTEVLDLVGRRRGSLGLVNRRDGLLRELLAGLLEGNLAVTDDLESRGLVGGSVRAQREHLHPVVVACAGVGTAVFALASAMVVGPSWSLRQGPGQLAGPCRTLKADAFCSVPSARVKAKKPTCR